jgi:hypothetical protein
MIEGQPIAPDVSPPGDPMVFAGSLLKKAKLKGGSAARKALLKASH